MFRTVVRAGLIGAALLATPAIGLLAAEQSAHATSLANLSVEQITDASTYIVRGTVTRTWTVVDDHGMVWTRAEVEVTDVLKGPDRPATIEVESMGGVGPDGQVVSMEGATRFSAMEDAVFFLHPVAGEPRFHTVGWFLGKYTIRRAPHDDRLAVVRYTAGSEVRYDARFLPVPDEAHRVYLDDLLSQVQARLKTGWDGKSIPGISDEKLREINAPERRMVK
jgi:hypothetical protein